MSAHGGLQPRGTSSEPPRKVYVLTTGEYSMTEIVGIFTTLEAAKAQVPRADWRLQSWSDERVWDAYDRWDREWRTAKHWVPSITEHELGTLAVDRLLEPDEPEEPAPPPPPRCDYRVNVSPGRSRVCTLELGHEEDHRIVDAMYTTSAYVYGGPIQGVDGVYEQGMT